MIKDRLSKLRSGISKEKADGFFITNPINILYFTSFRGLSPEEREVSLYVDLENTYLFLPRMYAEQGSDLLSVKEKLITCSIDYERDGIMSKWIKQVSKRSTVLVEEDDLTLEEYDYLSKISGFTLKKSHHTFEKLRIIKDSSEIEILRKVVYKTDLVCNQLVSYLHNTDYSQLTELDIVDLMKKIGREHGLLEFSFEPIVACGSGGSEPHYRTQNKKLRTGEVLLMDFGFKLDGYNSDLTRTLMLGSAPEKVKKMYQIVLDCNLNSIESTKPGKDAGNLHKEAVAFFKKHNVDKYFIHGLGHGIGLDVHEEPYFRLTHETILKPGMAVTIEPGLYFPNEFGIRIEDYVIITEDGVEVLSKYSPKDLIEVS